jgi:flagellar biosynthesis protein
MQKKLFRRAIGLQYNGEDDKAPEVTVKGDALDADQIVALAKRYGVPVVERSELARALDLVEQGEAIPESLYKAVAIVLAELDKQKQ